MLAKIPFVAGLVLVLPNMAPSDHLVSSRRAVADVSADETAAQPARVGGASACWRAGPPVSGDGRA
jgi:hypothetical protein